MKLLVVLFVLLLSQCSLTARSRGDRVCKQVKDILHHKGFTYPWWSEPLSTSSSSGCPARGRSLKCCPSSFDTTVRRREIGNSFHQKWLGSKLTVSREIFSDRKKAFDTTFKALLQRAHISFHAMFEKTYGMLYIQHADVFHALFKTLEKYYEDGRDHLESKLNEFFAILTRKMFEVLNAQYDFTESYLSCATIVISEKQGSELHRQIVTSLRRSFVATRAFAQGLLEAERVVSNVNKLPLDASECLIPLSQMVTCPVCAENRAYKPCLPYCTATTVKCLSPTFHLIKPWNEFSKAMEELIERLIGPYNVEAVVEPIHIKISEAIMNFQESGADLSQAVFSKCGKPTLKSRTFKKREVKAEARVMSRISKNSERDDRQDKSLERLLRETKKRVGKSRDLWSNLPRRVCNAISKEYSSQLCWNGTSTNKVGEREKGKDNGISPDMQPRANPSPFILEQIQILYLITDKLKTAFNGGDIQWVPIVEPEDEFGSGNEMGSGSGDVPTDLEDTDDDDPAGEVQKPKFRPFPPPDLNFGTRKISNNVPTKGFEDSSSPPSKPPFRPRIPIREDEEDEEDDEDGSNLNINSGNNKNSHVSRPDPGNDFGLESPGVPDTKIPDIMHPQLPTTTRSTTTTTTEEPFIPRKDPPVTVPPVGKKPENPGAKTVAVVNVFTPVIMSMLQKLFNFSS